MPARPAARLDPPVAARVRRIGRLAVAAEVLENPFNDRWFLDTGDHAQPAAAAPADLDVDGKDTLEALRPGEGPLPVAGRCHAALVVLSLTAFAAATSYPLALAPLFIVGFMELSFFAMAQTLVQLKAPPEIRGRVIRLFNMSSLGMRTFSGITVGVVVGFIGVHWSLALSAMTLLGVVILLFVHLVRAGSAVGAGAAP